VASVEIRNISITKEQHSFCDRMFSFLFGRMADCVFCGKSLADGGSIVRLTSKGCGGIAKASAERDSNIRVEPGQQVHADCRREFTNPICVQLSKRKRTQDASSSNEGGCTLRSAETVFYYKEHCLFCGVGDRFDGKKKNHKLIPVRTMDFRTAILKCCDKRSDRWCEKVKIRLTYVKDLPAADAVYHNVCSTNFRNGKQIPQCFSNLENDNDSSAKKPKLGRPKDSEKAAAFLSVVDNLEANDEEQTTVNDLISKMAQKLGPDCEAYSFKHMKQMLQEHFGDNIIITEINGIDNVVTFRHKAASILTNFFQQSRQLDCELEKQRVVEAAASLIKSDIKSMNQLKKEFYPSALQLSSTENILSYLPNSLRHFLDALFVGEDKDLKIGSIGQAMMQATRPRVLLTPLQLGLGVQMHHHFASRFLLDTLYQHGFCCSYTEVQRYERSAAVSTGIDIPGYVPGHFMQYVADNVDHNIRTLDGSGTFHGMGIITAITPKIDHASEIKRVNVSADDIAKVGRINIHHFTPEGDGMATLKFENFKVISDKDRLMDIDLLWKVSFYVRPQRPGWSGMMQLITHGEHPGQASTMFLPMIDLNPSDLNCVYSTLIFVCDHAHRYGVTPIITFDQPLWWKAMTIVESETDSSKLSYVVVRLGGFHTLMSFLGSIGHLMAGTGLQELLETVFAPNTVTHILSGKAVARAIRGHLLLDTALNTVLVANIFGIKLSSPSITEVQDDDISTDTDEHPSVTEVRDDDASRDTPESIDSTPAVASEDEEKSIPYELQALGGLIDKLLEGEMLSSDVTSSSELSSVKEKISNALNAIEHRTGKLWVMYMKCIDIVRDFLRSERTGDWTLHLQILQDMLPYFAASGHNLYTKSVHLYLQKMAKLEDSNPVVYSKFMDGFHVVRRSDRFWAGLSPDLVIEQVLMRSLKTTGGLTRGRGMTETQRLVWCLSRPVCAEVNDAMQQLTSVLYSTSEQHKDLSKARKGRDMADTNKLVAILAERNPFEDSPSLQNIVTGVATREDVNVEQAEQVGQKILSDMTGQHVQQYVFRKKNQVITPESKSTIRINGEKVNIDPQLLFQRLVIAGTQAKNLLDAFQYELCSYPPALFETKHVLLKANKPSLGQAIWATVPQGEQQSIPSNCQYVLDGGALLHRIPWQIGETFKSILDRYVSYVMRHYRKAVVIFDGYASGPSTKDGTHQRRIGKRQGRAVNFQPQMSLQLKKEEFLSNDANKQRFLNLLSNSLEAADCEVHHAKGDADLLIVQTSIQVAAQRKVILVGDDTDLLVLICYHAKNLSHDLFWRPEPKKGQVEKFLNIRCVREKLGEDVCENILFAHAILGCDTTSRVFGFGKGVALKLVKDSECFREQAALFSNSGSSNDEIIQAGEKGMLCLYKAKSNDNLDTLRHHKFQEVVTTSKKVVHPKVLPPTSGAVKYHSFRVFHQVQEWKGINLKAEDWGWKVVEGKMLPLMTDLDVAPKAQLEVIRCKCKTGCGKRCGCRGLDLECTPACSECRGICENMKIENTDDNSEDDYDST
jgi:hypothetical protein